ncbi:hypothetical protein ACFQZ4_46430 [Catellatospora coxensis]
MIRLDAPRSGCALDYYALKYCTRPSRVETVTVLNSDNADQLVLDGYARPDLDQNAAAPSAHTARCCSPCSTYATTWPRRSWQNCSTATSRSSHLKNWRLPATGYHGLLDRLPVYLDTITELEINGAS